MRTPNYPFHARSFLKRMIRMRKRLIHEGISKHDEKNMLRILSDVEKKLDFFPLNTREKMAGFIIRQAPSILYIMPGEKSKSHKKAFATFQQLYDEALEIKNEKARKYVC